MKGFSKNPLNLLLIFLLELAGLGVYIYLGIFLKSVIIAILLPTVAATIWGVFRVDMDPNKAVVEVKGIVRLFIEFCFFFFAFLILIFTENVKQALVFGFLVVVHYTLSWDRVWRMVRS